MDKEFAETFKEEIEVAEADKEALKRALAISKWKKAGGKIDKQPDNMEKWWGQLSPEDQKRAANIAQYKKEKKQKKEEVEIDEAKSKLPPHLAKFFDKDGNLKKDAAARVAKGKEKINWIDVTPKGYGPKEEVEEGLKDLLPHIEISERNNMDLEDTVKQIIGETNKNDKSDDGDGLDAVQPKAVKKKFKNRKDKDIDNDGDTDDSDKFLHKKRKAISKAISKEEVSEAYWKVSIPDMTPIFVETGSKSDIMKDMRKKLKPDALKGLEIERVSKSTMIKMYRELAKGGGEEEEPKKEETTMSKMFSHVKNIMKEKKGNPHY